MISTDSELLISKIDCVTSTVYLKKVRLFPKFLITNVARVDGNLLGGQCPGIHTSWSGIELKTTRGKRNRKPEEKHSYVNRISTVSQRAANIMTEKTRARISQHTRCVWRSLIIQRRIQKNAAARDKIETEVTHVDNGTTCTWTSAISSENSRLFPAEEE